MPEGELDQALELAARGRSWSRAMKLLRLPNVKVGMYVCMMMRDDDG